MFNLFASFLIWAIRGWCTWRGRVRVIRRTELSVGFSASLDFDGIQRNLRVTSLNEVQGAPYLIRYALFGWLPGDKRRVSWLPNIYLHNILLPDSDPAPHNHPWPWAWSLVLRGFYAEARPEYEDTFLGAVGRWPGDLIKLEASTFHRIALVSERDTWTLFITSGGKRQPWGFAVPGQGFVPHAQRERDLSASRRTLIPPALADEKVRVSL